MKKHAVAAVGLLVAAATGQWLETTIDVGGYPRELCYNSADNKVYCLCGSGIWDTLVVIDGSTNEVAKRLAFGEEIHALCYNPTDNKLYVANSIGVTVIDGEGDTVITTLSTGYWPWYLCYNPQDDKVYSASIGTGGISVIDGASDSVIATVSAVSWTGPMCYNPAGNKVYVAPTYIDRVGFALCSLTVINGASDSVIAAVPVMEGQTHVFCCNTEGNRVYCGELEYCDSLFVIDGAADSVMTTITLPANGTAALCYNTHDNKVYSGLGDVSVIDGMTNEVIATIPVRDGAKVLCYEPQCNKVYCAGWDETVSVIDGTGDTVLVTLSVGRMPSDLCLNPQQNRVYVSNENGSTVSVIRDSMPGGVAEEGMKAEGGGMNPTVVRGVLLLEGGRMKDEGGAGLLDAAGRKVMELHPGPNDIRRLAPGVYFVRTVGREPSAVQKVIVTR